MTQQASHSLVCKRELSQSPGIPPVGLRHLFEEIQRAALIFKRAGEIATLGTQGATPLVVGAEIYATRPIRMFVGKQVAVKLDAALIADSDSEGPAILRFWYEDARSRLASRRNRHEGDH